MNEMNIWLYHINPKNRAGHTHGWDVKQPATLLGSSDRIWPAGAMFNKVRRGDMICVLMKNIAPYPDGVYVIGEVRRVGMDDGASFSWAIDREKSAKVVVSPVRKMSISKMFPRLYGGSMQLLAEKDHEKWLTMLGHGHSVFRGTPVIKVAPSLTVRTVNAPLGNPLISRENGIKGERYVLALLKQRFSVKSGYKIEHVAANYPGADHDISVSQGRTVVHLVEVKTRVGKPHDPVIISERELDCRKRYGGKHMIFIVYLAPDSGEVHSTIEIGRTDAFQISPRQHWLFPNPV